MKKYENLARTIYDIGKYTFTALVIGQFITEEFNLPSMLGGVIFTVLAFVTAVKLERIKEG